MTNLQESKNNKSIWQELFDFSNSCLSIVIIILSINACYGAILKNNISYIQIALVYFLMLILGTILLYPVNKKLNGFFKSNIFLKQIMYSILFTIGMFIFEPNLITWKNIWLLFVPQIAILFSAFVLFPIFILFKSILSIKESTYLKEIIEKIKNYNYAEQKNKFIGNFSTLKKQIINSISEIKTQTFSKILINPKKNLIKLSQTILLLAIVYGVFCLIKYIGIIKILKFFALLLLSIFAILIVIGAFIGNSVARGILSIILKIALIALIIYCSPYILAILILLALAWLYMIFKMLF